MKKEAEKNLEALRKNSYPGRGLIVGLDESGEHLVQVYWIMGRSKKSRNRVFGKDEDGRLFTEIADPSLMEEGDDLSLIIYDAMREVHYCNVCIVSNGRQTQDVAIGLPRDNLYSTMSKFSYEPDKPNFTSRITAVLCWRPTTARAYSQISILRKSPWSDACDRYFYEINEIGRGFGYCVHTYLGDGDPLPSFRGEPYLLPLRGCVLHVANEYWDVLNPDNKVSLAAKFIPRNGPSEIIIINKYQKV